MASLRIQLRRDTAANWVSNNPILLPGELGIETDSLKFKIGNGSRWNATTSYAFKAGEANGLATLNSSGKIPSSQLPDSISVGGDFAAAIAALTTNSITEGSTNKYFTNQRAIDAVSAAISSAIATETTNRNTAISTAKLEAINTASTDATNKASTAKSEAISAAAAAADNKDTIAIASAVFSSNSYTDTKAAAEATTRTNAINTAISTEITNRNTAIAAAVSEITPGGSSTITLGTVSTGNPGTSVSITNTGTATAPLFNFTIPRGDVGPQGLKGDTGLTGAKGDTGDTGPAGIQGPQGDTGPAGTNGTNGTNGSAATISVGTVTTGAPGSSAIVTNAGTTSAAVLNFTIPQGAAGTGGSSFSGNSDSVTEGTTNLYFTNERAQTANNSRFTDVYVNINQSSEEMLTYINSNYTNNSALANTLDGYVMEAEANQPGGYAKLGVVSGTILDSVIPTTIARTSDIAAQIAAVVDGAPATFDTLKEISDYIAADQTAASSLTTLVGTKLSSATAASTYAPLASPTFTGTVSGITKSMVGLENVDNTTDALKPISTATQSALDAKLAISTASTTYATKASPVFTGTVDFSGATVTGISALPAQLNNSGKFLTTNGTTATWSTIYSALSGAVTDGSITANAFYNAGNKFHLGSGTNGYGEIFVDATSGRLFHRKVIGGSSAVEIINESWEQTLTNKTISGASNTITNIPVTAFGNNTITNDKLANSSITINGTVVALGTSTTISGGAKTFYNNTGTLPTTGMVAGDIYIQY
jgi:hypothetical protein